MAKIFFTIDDVDNTGTLYEEVLTPLFPIEEERNRMFLSILFLRTSILKTIKTFIDRESSIIIKEFSDAPAMIYDDATKFDFAVEEIGTDMIIIREAFGLTKIRETDTAYDPKYYFVVEALQSDVVTVASWDDFIDKIHTEFVEEQGFNPRVQKIIIENIIDVLKFWNNVSDDAITTMITDYNSANNITFNQLTFWQEPLSLISKKYWEKFSFSCTINDYDLYNPENEAYLAVIADRYFNNGYFDEIVIKINYFYWYDDFEKITDWVTRNLGSPLVSYRFQTLFSNTTKNRYFDDDEAAKYGDIQRKNTDEEEITMFEERLPIFLDKILTNPQVLGFELDGGYFGKEGTFPSMSFGDANFITFTQAMCKILAMSPFAMAHDYFRIYFDEPVRLIYVCIKDRVVE